MKRDEVVAPNAPTKPMTKASDSFLITTNSGVAVEDKGVAEVIFDG